jgi:hypothetical protein
VISITSLTYAVAAQAGAENRARQSPASKIRFIGGNSRMNGLGFEIAGGL